jgi:hypothetical protein
MVCLTWCSRRRAGRTLAPRVRARGTGSIRAGGENLPRLFLVVQKSVGSNTEKGKNGKELDYGPGSVMIGVRRPGKISKTTRCGTVGCDRDQLATQQIPMRVHLVTQDSLRPLRNCGGVFQEKWFSNSALLGTCEKCRTRRMRGPEPSAPLPQGGRRVSLGSTGPSAEGLQCRGLGTESGDGAGANTGSGATAGGSKRSNY